MIFKYVCVGLFIGSFVLYVSADTDRKPFGVPILGDDDGGGIEIIGPTISPANPPISQDSGIVMVTGNPDESAFKYHSFTKKTSAKPQATTEKDLTQTLPTVENGSTNEHTDDDLIEIYPDGHTQVIKNQNSDKTATTNFKKRPHKPEQEASKPKKNDNNAAPSLDQYEPVKQNQYQPKHSNSKQYESVNPNPKQYEPVSPNPKQYEPVSPSHKQYEPVSPNPKQYEPVNPSHKQYELVNPNPKQYEIVNPNADRYEVVKPNFNRYPVVKPDFDRYEVVNPNFDHYEPVNPAFYRSGFSSVPPPFGPVGGFPGNPDPFALDKLLRSAIVPYPGPDSNYEVVNPNYPNVNVQHPHPANHPLKKAPGLDALNAKVLDVLNLNVG